MAGSFLQLLAVVVVAIGVCFLGIGAGLLIGRKRRLGACSFDFDADKARRKASPSGGCGRGGSCGCSGDKS